MNIMKMMKTKTNTMKANANALTFWIFNTINILCTFALIAVSHVYVYRSAPTITVCISYLAIVQSLVSFMLNILFHKAEKEKEIDVND